MRSGYNLASADLIDLCAHCLQRLRLFGEHLGKGPGEGEVGVSQLGNFVIARCSWFERGQHGPAQDGVDAGLVALALAAQP